MESEAKVPDSDSDWQAIDIFVFSNGQQYSPPRKYHLQAEDINLWKSTLSFLAKTQYGPFHSTIDLYTIEGRKITDPLQLNNGGSYVAVQPPDSLIEARYDKYLIKASRSWEKRKAKRSEIAAESDEPKNLPYMVSIGENIENDIIKPIEERLSSLANNDASTIIKPQLLSAPQRRTDSQFSAKQPEKKRASIQSPLIIRKLNPSSLPASNLKNSFSKKKDSIKSTVKISKPEERYPPDKQLPRLSKTIRPPSKSRDSSIRSEAILPKVEEAISELKTSSSANVISTKIDEHLSTKNADLKNVIEDKELILVSNLFKNQNREMPSISVDPCLLNPQRDIPSISNQNLNLIPIQSILHDPVRQKATTTIADKYNHKLEKSEHHMNSDHNKMSGPENKENINYREVIESININQNFIKENASESISTEKLLIEQRPNRPIVQNKDENINYFNNKNKVNVPNINDNIKTQESPPRQRSINVGLPDDNNKENYVSNKLEEGLDNKSTFSTTIYNIVLDSQYIVHKIEETHGLPPTVIDKSLNDQHKATLQKGDVVNLKLNIEIENHNESPTKQRDNLNSQSVTIIHTDKGSQSNIDDQIIAQNKSLLSLITKEFYSHNIGDNHRVIIVQYNCCKYCNEYNAKNPVREANKNFIILLPIEKLEELKERCHCNATPIEKSEEIKERYICNEIQSEIQNQESSVIAPVKPTYSCMSLQRTTEPLEPRADNATQNIYNTPDTKSIKNVVMVSRKKSVAINEQSTVNTLESSKIIQDVNMKTQLVKASVESVGNVHNIATDNKSTQTEWCEVLLEAKLLSDGHYTFRFPSIELLKDYKLT